MVLSHPSPEGRRGAVTLISILRRTRVPGPATPILEPCFVDAPHSTQALARMLPPFRPSTSNTLAQSSTSVRLASARCAICCVRSPRYASSLMGHAYLCVMSVLPLLMSAESDRGKRQVQPRVLTPLRGIGAITTLRSARTPTTRIGTSVRAQQPIAFEIGQEIGIEDPGQGHVEKERQRQFFSHSGQFASTVLVSQQYNRRGCRIPGSTPRN